MKKITIIMLLMAVFLVTPILAQVVQYCGDGLCGSGETEANCEVDCRCVAEVVEITPPPVKQVEVRELEVSFFNRGAAVDIEETCGYDGNLDGFLCDPNEDWISCSEDCSTPSIDSLLCLGPECLWQEAWFARILILALVVVGIFIIRGRKGKKK
jgi:hypothetical protein